MTPGICPISIVPVRSGPSDREEIVTQLLFGETLEILEVRKNWTMIRCNWDGYEGWCDTKQVLPIDRDSWDNAGSDFSCVVDIMLPAMSNGYFLPLTLGASLPEFDGLRCRLGNEFYQISGHTLPSSLIEATDALIVKLARKYLYAPYLWGGRSPFGVDCSGFVQVVFKMAGIRLKRDAYQQAEQGRIIDFIELIQPGDLAFFENDKGRIAHVGLILGPDRIIHAYGRVRIDRIDHYGIFNEEMNTYTHKLRVIKRFLPDIGSENGEKNGEEIQIDATQKELF